MCAVHGPLAPCRCGYAANLLTAFIFGAAFTVSCGLLGAKAPDGDPCAAEIVRLEAERNAEVATACAGQAFDACPAVAAIDRKYDPFIRAQIECAE